MKAVFETAALADAIAAAARIASTRDDYLAGVLITNSVTHGFTVQATDGQITFRRVMPTETLSLDDADSQRWYIPAKLAARLFMRLNMAEGSVTEISDNNDGSINVRCKRTKAKLNLLNDELFPRLKIYDPSDLKEVEGLAKRVKQISFAANRRGITAGLHFDGHYIIATDQNVLARADCLLDLDEPTTLPLAPIAGFLKNTDTVLVGRKGNQFVFFTDDETQVSTVILQDPYPKVDGYFKLREEFDDASALFKQADMLAALHRMLAVASDEDLPRLRMRFKHDTIMLGMVVPGIGEVTDAIDAECSATPKHTYVMNLKYFMAILNAWTRPDFTLEFHSEAADKVYTAADDDGFLAMWMPIKELKGPKL